MAIAIVALLAFGGSYAYFTATTKNLEGKVTTGKVLLSTQASEITFSKSGLMPTESSEATVSYVDGSSEGTWIFFSITAELKNEIAEGCDVEIKLTGVKINDTELTTKLANGVYYFKNGDALATSEVAPTKDLSVVVTVTVSGDANSENGVDNTKAMDNEFTITLTAQSIQQVGITAGDDDAATAQNAYTALTTAIA